eukprot:RCo027385
MPMASISDADRLRNRRFSAYEAYSRSSRDAKSEFARRNSVFEGGKGREPKSGEKMRFKRGAQIGSGGFGRVYIALNEDTGELMAVKNIPFDASDPRIQEKLGCLKREINVMKSLDHPNIVRYLQTEKEKSSINVYMEYLPGGSIANLLSTFGKLDEKVVKNYTFEILHGLAYLHENNIVHRDIKAANLLLTVEGHVKLADFGAANILEDFSTTILKSLKGTPYWMAPEVITQAGHGWQADIWSLGCTVMEMLTAEAPFMHVTRSQLQVMHYICEDSMPITVPETITKEAQEFLLCMLKRNPVERPPATQLLLHAYLRDEYEASPRSASPSPKNTMAEADQEERLAQAKAEMERQAQLERDRMEEEKARERARVVEALKAQKVIEDIRSARRSARSTTPRQSPPPPPLQPAPLVQHPSQEGNPSAGESSTTSSELRVPTSCPHHEHRRSKSTGPPSLCSPSSGSRLGSTSGGSGHYANQPTTPTTLLFK